MDVVVGVRVRARARRLVASHMNKVSHVSVGAFAIGSCLLAAENVKELSFFHFTSFQWQTVIVDVP